MDLSKVAAIIRPLAPILGGLIGGPIGTIAATGLAAAAEALGVPNEPEAVIEAIKADPGKAETVLRKTEESRAEELMTLARVQADLYAELTRSETNKGWFYAAWRPAGMWAILALWLWALVPAPLLKLALDMGSLAAFTTLYLTLYMGGHTAKEWFSAHYAAPAKKAGK